MIMFINHPNDNFISRGDGGSTVIAAIVDISKVPGMNIARVSQVVILP